MVRREFLATLFASRLLAQDSHPVVNDDSAVHKVAGVNGRMVKKLESAEDKEHMLVRFDEEQPSGARVSVPAQSSAEMSDALAYSSTWHSGFVPK